MLELLLVVPTRNEEEYIKDILLNADRKVGKLVKDYKIVVVDASSEDNTAKIVKEFSKHNKRIDIIKDRPPRGKGADIMCAFSRYDSLLYGFIDSDMTPALSSLGNLLSQKNRYDVILGSRYVDGDIPKRPRLRLYISLTYNNLLSLIFDDGIKDHQCGFKIFNRKAVRLIRKYSMEKHWPWDTEAVLICRYGGLKICERKINWVEVRSNKSEANVRRAISDVFFFIIPMFRMFYRFRIARTAV